jgi:hypothetical protein
VLCHESGSDAEPHNTAALIEEELSRQLLVPALHDGVGWRGTMTETPQRCGRRRDGTVRREPGTRGTGRVSA